MSNKQTEMDKREPTFDVGDHITDGQIDFVVDQPPVWNRLLGDWLYLDPTDPEWSFIADREARKMDEKTDSVVELYHKALAL